MVTRELAGTNLKSLMDLLAGKDGMLRQKAGESLVTLGAPAVPSLIHALRTSGSDQVRWEAAKALSATNDPRSIPQLVKALEDESSDVAWLAAEALIKFKKAAWPPLLRAVMKRRTGSVALPHLRGYANHAGAYRKQTPSLANEKDP